MIPEFDDDGNLPPGIYLTDLEEVELRFGMESEIRQWEMDSLRWLVAAARKAGVLRPIVNGSFVTYTVEPNDVDCALSIDDTYPGDPVAGAEISRGLPFLQLQVVRYNAFQALVGEFFATDRLKQPKGVIEIRL